MLGKNRRKEKESKEPDLIIVTDNESIEIFGLKDVWVSEWFGRYRLVYEDSKYEYNEIYWSFSKDSVQKYKKMAETILDAYNRGVKIVEI